MPAPPTPQATAAKLLVGENGLYRVTLDELNATGRAIFTAKGGSPEFEALSYYQDPFAVPRLPALRDPEIAPVSHAVQKVKAAPDVSGDRLPEIRDTFDLPADNGARIVRPWRRLHGNRIVGKMAATMFSRLLARQ